MKAVTWMLLAPFRYFRSTMYRRILLSFFFIIVLTVTVLMTDFYFRTAGDLRSQSVDSMMRLTQQSSATLNSYMGNTKAFAWNYFGDAEFQRFVLTMGQDPDALSYYQNKFIQFINDNPIMTSVTVIQLDGFSTRVGTSFLDTVPGERDRLIDIGLEQNGKGAWVATSIDNRNVDAGLTLAFVQAIRNISLSSPGPTIGVMIYEMSPVSLRQWLKDVEGNGNSLTSIVRSEDGSVVYGSAAEASESVALSPEELVRIRSGGANGHFNSGKGAGSSLAVYQKLTGTDWLLMSRYPTHKLMQPVNDFTKRTVVIGASILLVAMLLASFLSSRTMTPLKELSKGMKSIEVGNYAINLPVRSKDEIGYLSTSFNRMAREIDRLIVKVYETELVKKNAEIKALQSQINPHFLYNTLGIIDSLSTMDGDGRVSMISRSLAKMFRHNISGQPVSTLEAEMTQIRLYLSIQKIRFDARLDYSIYLEPGLEDVPIPKLLFQPLVENSILHGIGPSVEGGVVRIEATAADNGRVEVSVWNNGCPIMQVKQAWLSKRLSSHVRSGELYLEESSIGLLNVQSRIRMLYGDACGLRFMSSEERGTTFTVTIHRQLPGEGDVHADHHH
ncbi:two-component system sensor histidine kinase YesM [Paenibacillus endophyticus]|uniref:Two-component system sensor histidine kinase YesM n=1 Tax=Paenibacillus endophyticus TaxID=1294268 RepID=A0A7W5G7W4_9BACL|nr:sensor histidine kinase [Paenibacillus endophyticus]MBB3150384.1 two-component system sensor histidine kinase YesM [Paenibacillus endophyticus]